MGKLIDSAGMISSDDVLACFIADNVFAWDDWWILGLCWCSWADGYQSSGLKRSMSICSPPSICCSMSPCSHGNDATHRLSMLSNGQRISLQAWRREPMVKLLPQQHHPS